MSGKFQDKMSILKQTLADNMAKTNQNMHINKSHTCSNVRINIEQPPKSRAELCIQQPIIIQKKEPKQSSARKQTPQHKEVQKSSSAVRNKTTVVTKKQVEAFKPIEIPVYQRKLDPKSLNNFTVTENATACSNKQIEIKIEKDDKQCLKKLFKKIHKLTEQLAAAQKQNMQLKVQLQNYKNVSKTCNNHEKIIGKLEGDNYRLEVDLNMAKRLLKQREDELKKLSSHVPKQIIKQVVIQKPVEVIVEVPRNVPGPERIVEKIVEVPKYIEVERKVPIQPAYEPPRQIIKTVEVPTIVEKPVYIDKPVYLDRPVQIERRVQVPIQMPPIEVPIYIDRPIIPEEYQIRVDRMEGEIEDLIKANDALCHENAQLRFTIQKLQSNLQILSRHNLEKNRQAEILLHNSFDYYPISPGCDISGGSIRYSVSSHPHTRII